MKNLRTAIVLIVFCAAFAALGGCAGIPVDEETIVQNRPSRPNPTRFDFPIGYESFSEDDGRNFLLNRTYSLGYGRYEDLVAVGAVNGSAAEWTEEMSAFGDSALAEGRYMNAAFYYRAAEFYTPWEDTRKSDFYVRFKENFYRAIEGDDYELSDIAYDDGVLSILRVNHMTPARRGTIILHAGYDGFKEELYSIMQYLAAYGYDIINFDVPWMSRTSTADSGGFDYRWENLISPILNHYEIEDVTIFGISLGGWLAIRAAAFEPRITRVIASSVSFDANQYVGWFEQQIARFARLRMPGFTNKQIEKQMESDPYYAWFFDHLMYVTRTDTPLEAANVLAEINEQNLHSDLVTQDVLILTGIEDHAIPFKMHNLQVAALINARSVTSKVFTEDVQGQNHCQVGNIGLSLDIIIDWLQK